MSKLTVRRQTVVVPDILVDTLRDREYAERLTLEFGVRLYFDISWAKLPLCEHHRDKELQGVVWTFSEKDPESEVNDEARSA